MLASRRWSALLLPLLLLTGLVTVACSIAPPVIDRLEPVDEATLAERARLGHVDTYGEHAEGSDRAREAAALALELGNLDEANAFAREQLAIARVGLLITGLTDSPSEQARAELDEAAAFAVWIGDQSRDGRLVLEAAQFLVAPRKHRKAIARAASWTYEADLSWGYENLWAAFEDDASTLAALQRLRWRAHRAPGLPQGSPRLSADTLAGLGGQSLDLLRAEADAAASERRPRDHALWIAAVIEADPLDLHALSAQAILDAIARGELTADERLLPDLATMIPNGLAREARLLLRHRDAPEVRALALARALTMLEGGTFGDAAQLLEDTNSGGTATERALRDTLDAMIELESGTDEGRARFSRWYRHRRADRSTFVSEWLSDFEQQAAPEGHIALAKVGDRNLVGSQRGRAAPRLSLAILGSVAIDAGAPKRTRDRAFAAIAGRDGQLGAKLAICRERNIFDEDCRASIEELSKLDSASPDYSAGLDALDLSANVRSSWFSPIAWLDGEVLPRIREQLLGFDRSRVAATTDFQTAALFAELAANRPDLARTRIKAYGGMLRPETRAIATMALLDLEDGLVEPRQLPELLLEVPSADIDAGWFLHGWLPADPQTIDGLFPGRSRLAHFARGLALARSGAWQRATTELSFAVEELQGTAKGVVAGRLALAAHLAGETTLRNRAMTIADAEDPEGFMPVYVRASVSEQAGNIAHAHNLYLQALAKRPEATPAFEGALRTLALGSRSLDRVVDALLLFPDTTVHWDASELLDAARSTSIDGPEFTQLWLARADGDAVLGIGEQAARLRPTAEIGLARLREELGAAPTPADAFPLAAKVLSWLSVMPQDIRVQYRETELWLTFLIGRDEDLQALAHAQPRYLGLLQPNSAMHPTLVLSEARRGGAVDDILAWALVRSELFESDTADVRLAISDLYATIEDPALAQYACLRMFQNDEFELAAERCIPLWNELGVIPTLAVDIAFLALNDPDLARAHGLDLPEFFATASRVPDLQTDPVWLLNASLWASKQGEDELGAALRITQLGLDPISPEPDDLEFGQARFRGALLRQQIVDQFDRYDRRRFALAAGSAIRSLDLRAAELYAGRLLAWLPPTVDDLPPDFTAQAPELLAATRREGDTSDAELRSMAIYAIEMAALLHDDLEADRIPHESLLDLLDAYAEDRGLSEFERIATDHPNSHIAKLILLGEYHEARMREPALALARELVALHPDSPLVLVDALPLLTGPEDIEGARRVLIAARKHHPDHPWLSDEAMPSVLTGADDQLPPWLRTPEAFEDRLAQIAPATFAALSPSRRTDLATSAEVFFAASALPNAEGLGASEDIPGFEVDPNDPEARHLSRVQIVIREPRASRCEGMTCAEPLIAEWTSRNYSLLWARELEVPAGPAIEFVMVDGESVINNLLVPTGGNLFVLISGTTPDDLEAFLPQIQLLRDGFRPLDWSLPANEAEALRSSGRGMPSDILRWRGRHLLSDARPGAGCLISADPELGELEPGARSELLLDLFLATREPWQRRALLECVSPQAPEAARLALLTLLDPDAAVHRFGRTATLAHPERVLTDTRRLLYAPREAAISNPALTTAGNQPPFGLLEVIAALPDQHSRQLTTELLGQRVPELRAIALAASATMDYFQSGPARPGVQSVAADSRTEVERLREVVEAGGAAEALVAAQSLMEIPGAKNLATLRARADLLISEGIEDPSTRGLALDLAWAIARELDSQDTKRLRKLAKAVKQEPVDDRPNQAENTRDAIESLTEDHKEGRALLTKRLPATTNDRPSRWVRRQRTPPSPREASSLEHVSLAELIPGREWTYVRVGNAGLFTTSLEGLLRRLTPSNPSDAYLVRTLIYDMLLQGSFALLSEEGGIDLSQPIECASPKGGQGFVCSASVRDRDLVLSTLATRELGDDAGLAIPLSLVTEFAGLPMTMGLLPVMMHGLVESPEDDFEPSDAREIAAERIRSTRIVAGHELEYYATIEVHEDHMVVDSEHYLFVGDRVFVFGGVDMAEQVLRAPPKGAQALASDPAFTAAVSHWQPGVALQSVDLSGDLGLDEVAMEVVFDNQGIEFSARVGGDRKAIGDAGQIEHLLPSGYVSRAVLPLENGALDEYFEDSDLDRCAGHGTTSVASPNADTNDTSEADRCGLTSTDKMPPVELAMQASAAVLGWYPEVGDSLWQRWVMVLPMDAKLRRALPRAGVRLASGGEVQAHASLSWVQRDGALIIASTPDLAQRAAALDSPPAAGSGSGQRLALFDLSGQRAAQVIREFIDRYEGDRRADFLRLIATMIGLVEDVSLDGSWSPRTGEASGTLSATIRLNLAESEAELALIDRWLASPEVGNASKLPRHLSAPDTAAGLQFRIEVHDAEQFARTSVPDDNPRISVEVLGPDELRLTVLPSTAIPAASSHPLSEAERKRALKSDDLILAQSQKIRDVAKSLRVSGDDTATVDAIVKWVHAHIQYEITPTSLDAVTVLDRAEGDCTEYALLTVTLLRAAGVPAELREGMAAQGDEMVAHAWAAWHDGTRWREVDPTAGTSEVGSGHLELEVVDVLAMISLGQFEVVAIDTL